MTNRPKTDYAQFADFMRHEEELIQLAAEKYNTKILELPYDPYTSDPTEMQENARVLYNTLHSVFGQPELSEEEFDVLVKKLQADMNNNFGYNRRLM